MVTDITVPKLGVEAETARLAEWLVAEGDQVAKDQPIATLETDKVLIELPSPAAGYLHQVAAVDGEYAIGHKLGAIATTPAEYDTLDAVSSPTSVALPPATTATTPAGDSEPPAPVGPESATVDVHAAPKATPIKGRREDQPLATPLVRRLAGAHNIDLSAVAGTGLGGRIRRRDIEEILSSAPDPKSLPAPAEAAARDIEFHATTLVGMRKTIAERMHASIVGSAQMTDIREHDATSIVDFRTSTLERADRIGFRLTYPAIFTKAAAMALKAVPELNATLEADELRIYESINIGTAVSVPEGLLVPVMRGIEHKSLRQINEELAAMITRARERKSAPEEFTGGTFTITNFGSYGSHFATPILLPPQVAILGIGAILERPVIRASQITIGPTIHTSLTVDHRVVDGETAGRFQNELARLFDDPQLLLFE